MMWFKDTGGNLVLINLAQVLLAEEAMEPFTKVGKRLPNQTYVVLAPNVNRTLDISLAEFGKKVAP